MTVSIAFFSDEDFDADEGAANPETVALSYFKRACDVPIKVCDFNTEQDYDFGIVLEAHSHWGLPMDCNAKSLIFIRYKDALIIKSEVVYRKSQKLSIRMFQNGTDNSKNGTVYPLEVATEESFQDAIKVAAQWVSESSITVNNTDNQKGQLSNTQFSQIVNCISAHRENVERLPGVGPPPNAGEEAHRDSLLAALSMRFSDATAESFSKQGKTDIRVKLDNDALFFIECKMWNGLSSVREAYEQLVQRYLVSRDRYGCLVFFVHGIKRPELVEPKICQYLQDEFNAIMTSMSSALPTFNIPATETTSEKVLAIAVIEVDSSTI